MWFDWALMIPKDAEKPKYVRVKGDRYSNKIVIFI